MPVDRRSLRSNSKSDTPPNSDGQKGRSNSNSSGSKKDRPASSRSTSSRSKSISKKGAVGGGQDASDEKPQSNGSPAAETGADEIDDVEMKEDSPTHKKNGNSGKEKDGDEEMTVVVPPAKHGQASKALRKETSEDTVMNGAPGAEDQDSERSEENVKGKIIAGMACHPLAALSHPG